MIPPAQPRSGKTSSIALQTYEQRKAATAFDEVVTEEPLQIRLTAGGQTANLAVTMRTPGNDFELAAGFVMSEQLVRGRDDIASIRYCVDRSIDEEQRYNIVNVQLCAATLPRLDAFERHFSMNSSCGICGRATLEALADAGLSAVDDPVRVAIETVYALPERMREAQRIFSLTGGLHAAALFDGEGRVHAVREDVGRHNAVDKLMGWAMMEGRSLRGSIMFVSGRASFEIVQKAAVSRVPVLCAVSAPSSLAVELAQHFNVTLLGFVRGARANVYSAAERITP